MLGIPVWGAILILAGATALYTFLGGIKAVIWIDRTPSNGSVRLLVVENTSDRCTPF